jgi:hypothetical protein
VNFCSGCSPDIAVGGTTGAALPGVGYCNRAGERRSENALVVSERALKQLNSWQKTSTVKPAVRVWVRSWVPSISPRSRPTAGPLTGRR